MCETACQNWVEAYLNSAPCQCLLRCADCSRASQSGMTKDGGWGVYGARSTNIIMHVKKIWRKKKREHRMKEDWLTAAKNSWRLSCGKQELRADFLYMIRTLLWADVKEEKDKRVARDVIHVCKYVRMCVYIRAWLITHKNAALHHTWWYIYTPI